MKSSSIHWVSAILGALAAEIAQIAAAFGWVAVHSHLINPGQPIAEYQAYAQASGPWVSIFAGFPIFYAASRWIGGNASSALVLWCVFLLVDGGLFVALPSDGPLPLPLIAASYLTKLAACYWGGRSAEVARTRRQHVVP
jgi:hypothetical protein